MLPVQLKKQTLYGAELLKGSSGNNDGSLYAYLETPKYVHSCKDCNELGCMGPKNKGGACWPTTDETPIPHHALLEREKLKKL